MLDTKPEWVPDWVWNEYQECLSSERYWKNHPWVETFESTMLSASCECVWNAMGRRREKLREDGLGRQWGQIDALMFAMGYAAIGIPSFEKFSRADRRKSGEKIAKLSSELLAEISKLDVVDPDLSCPTQFLSGHLDLAHEVAYHDALENKDLFAQFPEVSREILSEALRRGAFTGASNMTPIRVLDAIIHWAADWAKSTPPVAQVGAKDANRLYFIREMTKHFRNEYDGPLREQVAALTACIFDCEMDAVTVAKLAP